MWLYNDGLSAPLKAPCVPSKISSMLLISKYIGASGPDGVSRYTVVWVEALQLRRHDRMDELLLTAFWRHQLFCIKVK